MGTISQEGQLGFIKGDIHEKGHKCILSWNTQDSKLAFAYSSFSEYNVCGGQGG